MNYAKIIFRFIPVALALGFALNLSAQVSCISKGSFSIGTRVGFSTAQTNVDVTGGSQPSATGGNTALQLNVTPTLGYFFADNFSMGLGMDYLLASSKNDAGSTATTNETTDSKLLFGPFVRVYFPIGDDQAFFLGAVSGFGNSTTQVNVGTVNQDIRNTITSLGIGPGYTIFSSRCVSMEAQVKYNYGRSKNTLNIDGVRSSTMSITNAVDFVVGFNYFFTRDGGSSRGTMIR